MSKVQSVTIESGIAKPEGGVLTIVGGEEFFVQPSPGGPAIGTGTYAERPASPTEGDTYTVTSGVRRGSVYRCEVAGIWTLLTVALPQLAACVGLFDGERSVERAGSLLRRWDNISPRGRGYDLTWFQYIGDPQPFTAVGATGLLAYDTTGNFTNIRGALPAVAASGARTVAVLCRPTGPFNGENGNPNFNVIAGWGQWNITNAAFELCSRTNFVDVYGLHYVGNINGSSTRTAVASTNTPTESGPVVLVATYDGTTARIYREGSEIHTHVIALTGNATDSFFSVSVGSRGQDNYSKNLVPFAGAWDVALSEGEITTLTSLLRERYGL
jgi:hypothetical protein